ncbi:MAG TPA: N-acetylmuramoyl-L-alanine amidase [Bryobacterales bacterium]|nr:N-acetylmuramoyl-L-alanine amidase [Bryobacterales bacterium]
MRKLAHPGRDGFSLWPGTALALLLAVSPVLADSAAKYELARKYYEEATTARLDLESLPPDQQDPAAYEKVVRTFRRVYLTTPRSSRADDSLFAAAEIYEEMSRRFGADPYRDRAIDAYQFLIREYPYSHFSKQAREKLEELGRPAGSPPPAETPVSAAVASPATDATLPSEAPGSGSPPEVTGVRHWSFPGLTRIVVSLEAEPTVHSERLTDPSRVYFDLADTRLSPELKNKTIQVGDDLVKRIRLAQTQSGATRVVVDLNAEAEHRISTLSNPPRVVLELREAEAKPGLASAAPPAAAATPPAPASRPFVLLPASPTTPGPHTMAAAAPPRIAVLKPALAATVVAKLPELPPAPALAKTDTPHGPAANPAAGPPKLSASAGAVETAKAATPAATPKAARPTSRGERDLIRVLGLKIARVVIDAGHGGHDTGTIGPTGLMEKDLTLDVATRLGELIRDRIGSDVVYTRSDDTFIPLEQRTALANEKQADLFISIHANSSSLRGVRGIETYYLNLTADREAQEVAARENAASQKSIHDLQDVVSRIALTEKISESREFAAQVQRSLYTAVSRNNTTLRNRGVRKAPFVVLIGAHMPSVLAEISFLSNPRDERLLKTPAYRQKIAEALYNGVAAYARSLSQVEVAAK